jgi:hypothetical protein
MVLSTLESNKGSMQIHHVLQPPRLYDSTVIKAEDEVVGVMVVELDQDYLLSGFKPGYSTLEFIRLTQYNGRQKLSLIGEWGDAGVLGDIPDRIPVAGSLFRIEFPLQVHVELMSKGTALLMILAGVLCLGGAIVLFPNSRKWEKEDKLEKARSKAVAAKLAEQPDSADAQFKVAIPAPHAPAVDESEQSVTAPRVEKDETADAPEDAVLELPPMRLHYDIAERRKMKEAEHSPVELTQGIFRAYDIRGVIDKTLDSGIARNVGQAVGTLLT